ncbi:MULTISPECIES: recombinase family protein [Rhizobium]|uniref:Recombinase family protein n=1 Tax=Rhizobium aouanii TaxID=3118145 RepID=A0ABU8CL27_9HYPH|nr:recombinase family protein [Rhizobium acaciae]MCW1410748.1 recombinase family protein [Rhizobium acaciae]MCW1742953.1 recombinase family protein [Rhizobium acaciae]MCW1750149.1 recombinase family protein [Rhizobium acaciae]
MIYGYARVSTKKQDPGYQLDRLRKAGCDHIVREKKSGKDTKSRPEFLRLLASLQPGDTLLATVSDRVARDPLDLVLILREVESAGAQLRLLDEPYIDTTFDFADVIAYFRGWVARVQRLRILENTSNGRAMAKARGVKFGRKPKLSPRQRAQVMERKAKGEPYARIARSYGVSESTILRVRP